MSNLQHFNKDNSFGEGPQQGVCLATFYFGKGNVQI